MPRKLNNRRGFTLIEMMVSISIFVLVAFIVTSTLISVSNANRKAQELKQIMDNLNFSIQAMVLRLREGNFYHCLSSDLLILPEASSLKAGVGESYNCPEGGDAIVFLDPTDQNVVAYYLVDGGDNGKIVKTISTDGSPLNITSEEVGISDLRFYVSGMTADGTDVPTVLIIIRGLAKLRSGEATPFTLQTTVTTHSYAP